MLRLAQLRDGGITGVEDLAVLLQGLGEGEVIKIRVEVQGSVLLYRRKNWKPIWRTRREPSISSRQTLTVRRCRS